MIELAAIIPGTFMALTSAMAGFALFSCVYHLVLAFVALRPAAGDPPLTESPSRKFAILIPAYNEESGIRATLESCSELDYPSNQVCIYVVLDNCTDSTGDIAKELGAVCLERTDPANRGKGHALIWALSRINDDSWDAIVVLDADCSIGKDALRIFDWHLQSGEKVLQSNNVVTNPDKNALSYLLALANKMENDLFDEPKSHLRLATRLRGTGMVFDRRILEEIPWKAESVAEDAEYGFSLLQAHVPIRFVKNVQVRSNTPSDYNQMLVQRNRWIGGIRGAIGRGSKLFFSGLIKRDLMWMDAGYTTLIAGRFLVIFQWMACLAMAVACWQFMPGQYTQLQLVIVCLIPLIYGAYAGLGVLLLGVTWHRIALLAQAPYVTFRYLWMAMIAIIRSRNSQWNRTPR